MLRSLSGAIVGVVEASPPQLESHPEPRLGSQLESLPKALLLLILEFVSPPDLVLGVAPSSRSLRAAGSHAQVWRWHYRARFGQVKLPLPLAKNPSRWLPSAKMPLYDMMDNFASRFRSLALTPCAVCGINCGAENNPIILERRRRRFEIPHTCKVCGVLCCVCCSCQCVCEQSKTCKPLEKGGLLEGEETEEVESRGNPDVKFQGIACNIPGCNTSLCAHCGGASCQVCKGELCSSCATDPHSLAFCSKCSRSFAECCWGWACESGDCKRRYCVECIQAVCSKCDAALCEQCEFDGVEGDQDGCCGGCGSTLPEHDYSTHSSDEVGNKYAGPSCESDHHSDENIHDSEVVPIPDGFASDDGFGMDGLV